MDLLSDQKCIMFCEIQRAIYVYKYKEKLVVLQSIGIM